MQPEYIAREEFEARTGVLEREVEGEKLVTRHVLEQTRRNGDDLAAIKSRLERVESAVSEMNTDMRGLKADMRGMKAGMDGLRKEMPGIVSGALREVMSPKKGK